MSSDGEVFRVVTLVALAHARAPVRSEPECRKAHRPCTSSPLTFLARVTRSRFALSHRAAAPDVACRLQPASAGLSIEPRLAPAFRNSRDRRKATISRETRQGDREERHLHRPRIRALSWLGRPNRYPPLPAFSVPATRRRPFRRSESADTVPIPGASREDGRRVPAGSEKLLELDGGAGL